MLILPLLFLIPLIVAEQWCPDEDINDDERGLCYKYNRNPMTFDAANAWCLHRNYALASIHSQPQNDVISTFAQGNIDETYGMFWIGAQNTGSWNWVDNSPFNYSNWDTGEPLYSLATLEMANAKWTTQHPTSTFPFVCSAPGSPTNPALTTTKKPVVTPKVTQRVTVGAQTTTAGSGGYTFGPGGPTINYNTGGPGQVTGSPVGPGGTTCPPPSKGNCPSDWTYYGSTASCYMRLFSESWNSAEDLCTQLGGHLASIHTKAEGSFIARLSRTNMDATAYNQLTWIGLSYINGRWTWSDGTKFDFPNWAPKYPVDPSNNLCVALAQDNQQESWINGNCDIIQRAYVCKKPS